MYQKKLYRNSLVLALVLLVAACAGLSNYIDKFTGRGAHIKFIGECVVCHATGKVMLAEGYSYEQFIALEPHVKAGLECIDCHKKLSEESNAKSEVTE